MSVRTKNVINKTFADSEAADLFFSERNSFGKTYQFIYQVETEPENVYYIDETVDNPILLTGSGGGGIESIVAGTNITVDDTDPQNPIISATGGGSPAGSDTQIQYNNAGAFGADSGFTRDVATGNTNISATYNTQNEHAIKLNSSIFGSYTGSAFTYLNSSTLDSGFSGLLNDSDIPQYNTVLQYADGNTSLFGIGKNAFTFTITDGTDDTSLNTEFNNFSLISNLNSITYGISQSAGAVTVGNLTGGNSTKITIDDVNEQITISNLSAYDDDTAAGVAGLTAGMVYMTTGSGSAPLNAAGILMIKQ